LSSRLFVISYIFLCLIVGFVLAVLPWIPSYWLGLSVSDWGNNYFLILAARKAGYGLQRFVASGWIRGAVSGVGLLNIGMGLWELVNFRQAVNALDSEMDSVKSSPGEASRPVAVNDAPTAKADPLSDYPRRNR
jgi:hypothetical protein